MPNTKLWTDPDGQITNTGPSVGGVYLVDPTTQKAISPAAAGGGGPVTVADGADVTQGSIADAAVTGDNAGTVNAHLRGLTKSLNPTTLADNLANPTAPLVGAFLLAWNGTTWDRVEDYFPSTDAIPVRNGLSTVAQLVGFNGTTFDRLRTDQTGTMRSSVYGKNVAAGDTPLLLDASGRPIVNLAQVGGATISLGQQLAAASIPAVLPAAQIGGASGIALENGGNLASAKNDLDTIAGSISGAKSQVNVAQVNGATPNLAQETGGNLALLVPGQGSTTSGQQGPLVQAAVTSASPTYTNGQTSPITQTTSGGVRAAQSGNWTVLPGNTPNTTPWLMKQQAANTVFIAAGTATNTVVKGTPGTFYGVFASTIGAGGGLIYDNATTNSGTPVGAAPTAVGFDQGVPAAGVNCTNGITVAGSATNPALTVFFL